MSNGLGPRSASILKATRRRRAHPMSDVSKTHDGHALVAASQYPAEHVVPNGGNGDTQPADRSFVRAERRCIRTLIADDHALFVAGMYAFLEGYPGISVVGCTSDGIEAVSKATELQPDIVLMDVTMPALNGIDATRQIRARAEHVRVLIISMHAESPMIRRVFHEGASGFLLKRSAPGDLIRAINAVANGETFLCPSAASVLMGGVREADGGARAGSKFEKLTAREREVLQLIAEGKSSREIAEGLRRSVKTIETHRARLMRKLDLHSVADLTKCALREGITTLSD